ncbi:hypothetical protein SRB5_56680 [Streptomyces sp. RB5]|uniref:Uncharacterized protein n=1 Tax=Streptomyces smaragdinus TaxID=2585196 RepID=A0A7K0CPS3_9ACTN|nr:hypothetical protein [Streptomyces smaragdinus]MQY15486.1 hypothetical protein [Streptomyces smaragdinus]
MAYLVTLGQEEIERLAVQAGTVRLEPYWQFYEEVRIGYRGLPREEILPLLRQAAEWCGLDFTEADLREQADAVSEQRHYLFRVLVA